VNRVLHAALVSAVGDCFHKRRRGKTAGAALVGGVLGGVDRIAATDADGS